MADFSSFGEADFDAARWITAALQLHAPDQLPQQAAMLRMKLQLLSMEVSNSIEDLSTQCLARIPKTIRDIEHIKKEAQQLKVKLVEFEEKLTTLEGGTSESIRLLAELDLIKTRMEATNKLLQDSEKFKSLLLVMDSSFSHHDNKYIASTLQDLNTAYTSLKDIQEFKSYRHSLTLYGDKLESLVRPRLLQAFTLHNTEDALECIAIFAQIGRSEQVQQFYLKSRLVPLGQLWKSFDPLPPTPVTSPTEPKPTISAQVIAATPPARPITQWLPSFYNEVMLFLAAESRWLSTVFPEDHGEMTASLLQHFFASLAENFEAKLASLSLDALIPLYTSARTFVRGTSSLFSGTGASVRHGAQFAVLQPFRATQLRYASLERSHLSKEFSIFKPQKGDYLATINGIDNSMPRLFLLAESAIERCLEFTEGTEVEGLLSVLSVALADYLSLLSQLLLHLAQLAGLDVKSSTRAPPRHTSLSGSQFQDWRESYFQGALQLLEIIGKFGHRLNAFMHTLKSLFSHQRPLLFPNITKPEQVTKEVVGASCLPLYGEIDRALRLFQVFNKVEEAVDKGSLFQSVNQSYAALTKATHDFVFETMFSYIRAYVKMIGEYILLLPEMLSPFDHNENVHHTKDEPSADGEPSFDWDNFEPSPASAAPEQAIGFVQGWVNYIAKYTSAGMVQRILEIPQFSPVGANQMATDIGDLLRTLSVVGAPESKHLELIQALLKTKLDKYFEFAQTLGRGGEKHLAVAIGKRRGLNIALAGDKEKEKEKEKAQAQAPSSTQAPHSGHSQPTETE